MRYVYRSTGLQTGSVLLLRPHVLSRQSALSGYSAFVVDNSIQRPPLVATAWGRASLLAGCASCIRRLVAACRLGCYLHQQALVKTRIMEQERAAAQVQGDATAHRSDLTAYGLRHSR